MAKSLPEKDSAEAQRSVEEEANAGRGCAAVFASGRTPSVVVKSAQAAEKSKDELLQSAKEGERAWLFVAREEGTPPIVSTSVRNALKTRDLGENLRIWFVQSVRKRQNPQEMEEGSKVER